MCLSFRNDKTKSWDDIVLPKRFYNEQFFLENLARSTIHLHLQRKNTVEYNYLRYSHKYLFSKVLILIFWHKIVVIMKISLKQIFCFPLFLWKYYLNSSWLRISYFLSQKVYSLIPDRQKFHSFD